MKKKDIFDNLCGAIHTFYEKDSDLVARNNYEVTISCKLSQYLCTLFKDYDVDSEYNKKNDNPKILHGKNVRPDIIIHKRGTPNNLVCIEIKKAVNTDEEAREKDYKKLREFTSNKFDYNYQIGFFIDFSNDKCEIFSFENGGIKESSFVIPAKAGIQDSNNSY